MNGGPPVEPSGEYQLAQMVLYSDHLRGRHDRPEDYVTECVGCDRHRLQIEVDRSDAIVKAAKAIGVHDILARLAEDLKREPADQPRITAMPADEAAAMGQAVKVTRTVVANLPELIDLCGASGGPGISCTREARHEGDHHHPRMGWPQASRPGQVGEVADRG